MALKDLAGRFRAGEAREKMLGSRYLTVSATVVLRVVDPAVPVTVMVYVPAGVPL
jgi:hypothetical protein